MDQAGLIKKMRSEKRKKIIRLLGVGFDSEDGHVRITKGEKYDILMGSEVPPRKSFIQSNAKLAEIDI